MAAAPVTYVRNFVSDPDAWFARLWADLDWERRPDAPRREYWTNLSGRPYTYGRRKGVRTYLHRPDHPLVAEGRSMLRDAFGVLLEGCFLNGYEGKRDWLGWHADDDPGIDHGKPIAIVTVGKGRTIQFQEVLVHRTETEKGVYGPVESLMLEPGSLALMLPGMQFTHEHRIPKSDREVGERVSLTYRGLV